MKAWLITWEWANDAAAVTDAVVAILNPRLSPSRVAEFVEFLYAGNTANIGELAAYARRSSNNPYRAQSDFNSHVHCGHNPYLHGRLVEDLTVTFNPETGTERITWTELPLYRPAEEGPRETRGRLRASFTRRIGGPVSHELVWDRERDGSNAVGRITEASASQSSSL